jgi:membrane-bound lytic murein transglycosylase MltF
MTQPFGKELSMPGESERNPHAWEEIVKQLTQEQDRSRVAELAHKLNEAMLAEEREKVRRRLGVDRLHAA